jgi:hypothetical protein
MSTNQGPSSLPREHGTQRGWNQHKYRQEPQCDACRAWQTEYVKAWRRRTGRTTRTLVPVEKGST